MPEGLKVRELIELLSKMDPEAQIEHCPGNSRDCSLEPLAAKDVWINGFGVVVIGEY